jgi:hypothetical protein
MSGSPDRRFRARSSRSQNAELVTFWVSHDDPCDISLTDVDPSRPELLQASNFGFLIVRTKVEVDSVLSRLLLAARHQPKPCRTQCVDQEVTPGGPRPDVFKVERRPPNSLTRCRSMQSIRTHSMARLTILLDLHSGPRSSMPEMANLPPNAGLGCHHAPLWGWQIWHFQSRPEKPILQSWWRRPTACQRVRLC